MNLPDQRILLALRQGKRIQLPEFTSNDEFFLAKKSFYNNNHRPPTRDRTTKRTNPDAN